MVIMFLLPLLLMAQRKAITVETDDNKVEKPPPALRDKHGNRLESNLWNSLRNPTLWRNRRPLPNTRC